MTVAELIQKLQNLGPDMQDLTVCTVPYGENIESVEVLPMAGGDEVFLSP